MEPDSVNPCLFYSPKADLELSIVFFGKQRVSLNQFKTKEKLNQY